jgi:benzoyl-CoA-dihydrodiol lyase
MGGRVAFAAHPERYRHWRLSIDPPVAELALDVAEDGGLRGGYALKLNSYDLGVWIELSDAVQRLRFEHPEVRAVIVTSAKDGVFCAGANITMLATASHAEKVNFCKFTNETLLAIEDATENSGQAYLCAVNGTASGGGYELALATGCIILADDNRSAVALPEVPLLGVLPGTGGLTRLVDKRGVRRDHADFVATVAEGVRGRRALDWRLVDELATRSTLMAVARERARGLAERSDRPAGAEAAHGVVLDPLAPAWTADELTYTHVHVALDRRSRIATLTIHGPGGEQPTDLAGIHRAGAAWWPLAAARELDDAILLLRFNEPELGIWVLRTVGDPAAVLRAGDLLTAHAKDWLVREVTLLWKRTLTRLDLTARSLIAQVEAGSCFAGLLLELVLAADRSVMLDGVFADDPCPAATVTLDGLNCGALPMANGLTRLETRFWGRPEAVALAQDHAGEPLDAAQAERLGLVTLVFDDIDWPDETRLALQERASMSPDALTGMEASLRFAGPETMATKIFGRLSAWQNWVFQRPNAAGEDGALRRFGTGQRARFDLRRT